MKRAALVLSSFLITAAVQAGGWAHQCDMHPGGGCKAAFMAPVFMALLALGYWVLRVAEKEQGKLLKKTGRAVAAVILLGSVAGLLCPLLHCAKRGSECEAGSKTGAMCPFSGAATQAPAEAPKK